MRISFERVENGEGQRDEAAVASLVRRSGVRPYSETHEVVMVDGTPHGYEYGHLWPLRSYTLRWTCGHTAEVTIACLTPCEQAYDMSGECPDCYTGPYFNVWD